MSFDAAAPRTATSVTPLRIQIIVPDVPADSSIEYAFEILDQDGNVFERRAGNGLNVITAQEQTDLLAMVTRWRGLQEGSIA